MTAATDPLDLDAIEARWNGPALHTDDGFKGTEASDRYYTLGLVAELREARAKLAAIEALAEAYQGSRGSRFYGDELMDALALP